jgi:hypothetical protein
MAAILKYAWLFAARCHFEYISCMISNDRIRTISEICRLSYQCACIIRMICHRCMFIVCFAASILELFTHEMLALLRLTCKMIFDVHHRGRVKTKSTKTIFIVRHERKILVDFVRLIFHNELFRIRTSHVYVSLLLLLFFSGNSSISRQC